MMRTLSALLLLPATLAAAPPVTALAYRPGGAGLAAGVGRELVLLDAAGVVSERLALPGRVSAVAFSRDGAQLAIAAGHPGQPHELRVYKLPLSAGQVRTFPAAHADVIPALAFGPDGSWLVSGSYDRLVRVWSVAATGPKLDLKDHSDAVYGVTVSPDGKLLATAAADRAVKVWDAATGKRLYTLSDPTDWVYAVAFAPVGNLLAAAGADRSLRVWRADLAGGKLVGSAFAHNGPVLHLAYAADGATLFTAGEDRVVKSWDAAKLTERVVFPAQPEVLFALALRPDGKQLALGRFDGKLLLLDAATGKMTAEPLPEKPQPPIFTAVEPRDLPRGQTIKLKLTGTRLAGAELTADRPGFMVKRLSDAEAELTTPADAAPGSFTLKLKNVAGESAAQALHVNRFATVAEREPNDSPGTGQLVTLPITIVGELGQAGEVDFFRFDATAGQEVGVQVTLPAGGKLDPVLELFDARGTRLAAGGAATGLKCPAAGSYAIGLRDRDYRGGAGFGYRLHVGPVPVMTSYFPPGLQRGTTVAVAIAGVNLGGDKVVSVHADTAPDSRVPVPSAGALNAPSLIVGEFPEAPADTLAVPGTGNGRLDGKPGLWKFPAKKGDTLIIEALARRHGSPADPAIDILDAVGKPVPRAVLRCQAKTYVTFRDHDSAGPGIRLETWNELAIDDHLFVNGELMRIKALPRNPDDDCQFYAPGGSRQGFLETTPSHHPLGEPMYKVALHPPGTTFPPNGMPVFALDYRNDDGGLGYGKDAKLTFTAPADGTYQVRVRDARGYAGPDYTYRITVRPPRPDFRVSFTPTAPSLAKGQSAALSVTAERLDGYAGPIQLKLTNLPPGFTSPPTFIEAGQTQTHLAITADANAAAPDAKAPPLKLLASADIMGKKLEHETAGGLPKLIDPGDLVTTTAANAVSLRPGHEARLKVTVERRNGFKGRVPLDVRGLPHGVRVLDIGLNGILLTERDSTREIVLYAEPWVTPQEHPLVVLATREGKGSEHAAPPVLLKVEK